MKKGLIYVAIGLTIMGCKIVSSVDATPIVSDVCYSELNLTDAECDNVGMHNYSSTIDVEGINIDCGDDFQSSQSYSFIFGGDETVTLEHPSELIWGSYTHTFQRVAENTYIFSGPFVVDGDILATSWEIIFHWWGFQDRLEMTYDCVAGTCGCITNVENRLGN